MIQRIVNKLKRLKHKYLCDKTLEVRGLTLDNSHWRIENRNLYPIREELEMFLFLEKFNKGDVFWDIGANIGFFSLTVAKEGITVFAFEPDSLTCSVLNKNIYLNKLDNNLIALPIALNDTNQINYLFMRDFLPANAYNSFEINENERGKNFNEDFKQGSIGLTGDYLVTNSNSIVKAPTVMKIDVDGNEYKVLLGLKGSLDNVRLLAIELGYDHPHFNDTIELIKSYGFREIDDPRLFIEKRDENKMRNFYFEKE